jgi:hypothetical protein
MMPWTRAALIPHTNVLSQGNETDDRATKLYMINASMARRLCAQASAARCTRAHAFLCLCSTLP